MKNSNLCFLIAIILSLCSFIFLDGLTAMALTTNGLMVALTGLICQTIEKASGQ